MTLDPAKLLAFSIPQPLQQVTRDQVALYALSVGLGQDPLDPRQRVFVDPAGALRVMPTMALILAHPGFWLGDPESGVDATGVLHADQAIELFAPLPVDGAVISRSEIVGLVDKGAGKAALLRTETLIEDVTGRLLARLLRTTFLRGGGGFGGDDEVAATPAALPDRAPDHVVELAVRPEQALLYRLNGDLNPLHADPDVAKRAGFDRPILHGLCTMGIICHALLRALADYDEQRLRRMKLRFTGVVSPGETLRTEIWEDGSFRTRVVERDGAIVAQGTATIAALLSTAMPEAAVGTDRQGADGAPY